MEELEIRKLLAVSIDASGWTQIDPSSDTRIIYVSSSTGSDSNNGLSQATPVKTLGYASTLLRDGMPDWLLLKRGDSFSGGEGLGHWVKSGRSAQEPMLISAYGTGERPLIKTGQYNGIYGNTNFISIVGLHFYANFRDPASPDYNPAGTYETNGISWSGGNSLLVEDCLIDYFSTNMVVSSYSTPMSNVAIRRSIFTDAYSTTVHAQGAFIYGVNNITFEGNVFDHNGWNESIAAATPTTFNHNIYFSNNSLNVTVKDNIIANASSTGLQARSGGNITGNLFVNNPLGMNYGVSTANTGGPAGGKISGNIFLAENSRAIYGIDIFAAQNLMVSDNIMSGRGLAAGPGIQLSGLNDADPGAVGFNGLTIQNNVINGWGTPFWSTYKMVPGGTGGRGLRGLVVRNNDFQDPPGTPVLYHGVAFNSMYETWSGNRYWSSGTPAEWFYLVDRLTSWTNWHTIADTAGSNTHVSYPDTARTIASYNATLGGAATMAAFLGEARKQSKSNWRLGYTAAPPITYIQQGFATYAVMVNPTSTLQTSEMGGTASFTVALSAQPTANVTVGISSSNTGEAIVDNGLLTFTPSNWNVPQTVTVIGIDDSKIDQDVTYSVVIAPAQSTDPNFNGFNASDLTLVNQAMVPTINFGGLALGLEASPYTLGLSAANMGAVTSWSVNWGDGTVQQFNTTAPTINHTYADNGSYTITATATSVQGTVSNTKALTVSNVAPTLTISGANSANEASSYTLNLAAFDPAPDTVSSWKITWGDGVVQTINGNPTSVTHVFADSGNYTISATATDEDGTYNANTKAVIINNVAPTLTLSGAGTVNQNSSYAINFTVSDPGTDTVSAWNVNWGDGQTNSLAGAARSSSHTYTVAGTFTITLTATDEDGSYSITGTVGVADTGGASISGAATSNEGAVYTLSLSTTNASPLSWLIDWGDGASQSFNGNPSSVTHIFADNGAYTIHATLNAASGTYSTTKSLSVANVAPTLTLSGAASANEGSLYTLNLASSDVGPDTISSWRITWGDGSVQMLSGNPGFVTHTFADNGAYTISATATDEDGTYSAAGKSVAINKVDPILNLSGNGTVNQGSPYAVGFSVTDPGADTVSSWTINWGDGQSSTLAGSARSANHSYSNTGNFTITLSATDEDGTYSITRPVKVVATTGGVSISGATTANEGSPFTLLLSAGSGNSISWLIDWGDGSSGSASGASPSVNHTFADNGNYNIHATANIDGNTFSSNTISLNVRNIAPAISVSQNTALSAGANQVLNLSASDPGTLDTVSWSINWGDGVTTTSSGLASQVNHTYPSSSGNYVVAITATDKDGGIASTTQYLILNNSGPAISLTGNASSPEGSTYNLDFSASGTGASTISGWTINWGDGSSDNFAAGSSSASHLYSDNGTFSLTISAAYDGGTAVTHKNLIVTNVAPTLSLGGSGVAEGSPFVLSLGTSDPGNDHVISWMIAWGDGLPTALPGTATSASHTYADNKIYNIVVTANDEDGYYSSVKSVTISNVAPSLLVGGANTIERGSIYTLSLTSADPGADAVSSWVIDWGDGASTNVSEGFANLTHIYENQGSFTINVSATDEDGQWQANPLAVNVTQQTHNLTPEVALDAGDLTQSSDFYEFSITLNYPDVSIVPDMTHVLVSGPNDFSEVAQLQTLVGEDTDTTFVATYRITPGDGHWDFEDNGIYTVSLTDGTASSPPAAVLGTFQAAVPIPDNTAPNVSSSAMSITSAIGSSYSFTVHYADNSGAFLGDFDDSDLLVTGPNGFSAFAKFVSVDQHNNATYSLVAPGGTWNAADNGTYTVTLANNAVHDAAGNALAGGIVGSISVNVGDIAGNTLKTAKTLGITRTSKTTLSNFVGSSDHDDYFKVTFKSAVSMNLSLSSGGSFARLRVLSSKGKTLKSLSGGAMTVNLNAGTYYIRLYSLNTADTVYKVISKTTFSTTKIAA